MPFGYNNEYKDWDDCIAKNRDKKTPEKYCGYIKHQTEDIIKPECLVKAYNHYSQKYPNLSKRELLDMSFNHFKSKQDFEEDEKDSFINKYVEGDAVPLDPELFKTISFYVPLSKIEGNRDNKWEHNEIYNVDPKEYYNTFPPVTVIPKDDGKFEFSDGFHRVNFCIRENLPVPCLAWKKQEGVHTHKRGVYSISTYLVKDSDCESDLAKNPTTKCQKGKKTAEYYRTERAYDKIESLFKQGKLILTRKEAKIKKGRGWFGESERHSKARKTGHVDLISFEEGQSLDMILYDIALQLEDQIHDFMTHDAEATHLQELFEQMREYEKSYRTPEAQAMVEAMGQLTPPVEQITLPYSVMNTESGKRFQGEVIKNFRNNTTQLTPVSSSNVRGVGQFKNELLVQFRGNDRIAQRTYRYTMESPEMAEEAYNSLIDSPSPGRWVWENIRGHRAGEPVTSNKLAPSLSPPGKGKNTIGGTSASLLEYQISNRVPVSRVQGFEKAARQMERQTSNPSKNPNVGSRIEGALESRRSARDRGVNQLGIVRKLRQLPKLDFTVKVVEDSINELHDWIRSNLNITNEDDVKAVGFAITNSRKKSKKKKESKGYGKKKPKEESWQSSWEKLGEEMDRLRVARIQYREYKKAKETHLQKQIYAPYRNDTISVRETENYTRKRQFEPSEFQVQSILEPKGKKDLVKLNFTVKEVDDIVYDLIPIEQFTFKSMDFEGRKDFSILHGPITRAGLFPYKIGGYKVNLYKQWDNLKDIFSNLDYIPFIGSQDLGAHYAETLGFAYNFTFDEKHQRVYGDIITFEDMNKLTNNYNPSEQGKEGWEVSIGFKDHRDGQNQIIDRVDHLAGSLRNKEMGRCRAGGDPCYINYKNQDQNLTEVVSHARN